MLRIGHFLRLVFGNFAGFVGWGLFTFCFVLFCFFFKFLLYFLSPVPCPLSSPSSLSPSFTCFYNDGLAPSDFEQAFVKKEKGKK